MGEAIRSGEGAGLLHGRVVGGEPASIGEQELVNPIGYRIGLEARDLVKALRLLVNTLQQKLQLQLPT